MVTSALPSTRLIVTLAAFAAAFTALAALEVDAAISVRIAWVAGASLLALVMVDLTQSLAHWRRSPLELERHLPQVFAVGVPLTIPVSLLNSSAQRRRGEYFEHGDSSFKMGDAGLPFEVGPGQRVTLSVSLTPHARGLRQFDRAQLRLRSEWGLLDFNLRIGNVESRRVFPNFSQQARFAWLAGERRLTTPGIKNVQRRGSGTDFDQLVGYQAGDPIRHIDWKATVKQGTPIVRKFRDERDQNVMLLLDCGRRMRADDSQAAIGASHFDQALNALMLLAFVALSHGDAVGAMTFGSPPALQRRFAPRKGRTALNGLMSALAEAEPTATFSDYESAAADLLRRQHKRSLVVIITNSRNEDATELSSGLRLLNARHAVILANLRESIVDSIASQALDAPGKALESASALEYGQARARLMAQISHLGIFTIDCEPNQLAVELINRYTVLKRTGSI